MLSLALLLAIALASLSAPLYAMYVAGNDPFRPNLDGSVTVAGRTMDILQAADNPLHLGSAPIGPTWRGPYFLGADNQGRDVAVRLLYGGRDSLLWAFPVYLLAISLSIVLISQGLRIGPFVVEADNLLLPIGIIGIVYVPYAARPVRGQVLALKQSEFVLAAVALGVPDGRILVRDIFPNVLSTLIVFAPLIMALNLLTESALSFLSIGVQPPAASWGSIIADGQTMIYLRPIVAIAPGIAIVITVLALNVLGDGVRDALDPRAKLREQG
jgi:peptide/nickel transport system permease protein